MCYFLFISKVFAFFYCTSINTIHHCPANKITWYLPGHIFPNLGRTHSNIRTGHNPAWETEQVAVRGWVLPGHRFPPTELPPVSPPCRPQLTLPTPRHPPTKTARFPTFFQRNWDKNDNDGQTYTRSQRHQWPQRKQVPNLLVNIWEIYTALCVKPEHNKIQSIIDTGCFFLTGTPLKS